MGGDFFDVPRGELGNVVHGLRCTTARYETGFDLNRAVQSRLPLNRRSPLSHHACDAASGRCKDTARRRRGGFDADASTCLGSIRE